jgi:hypothetical protein
MYNTRIALISRGIRLIAPAVQRPHAYFAHARAISTVGPRAAAPDPTRPTATPGTAGPKKPQDRNLLYIGGGLVGLGAVWYYYAEKGRTANQQEGLGRQKVRLVLNNSKMARGALTIRRALKRSARRSLSRKARQNIRILKQKHRRRCNLQEIKLAKAWSVGNSVLKEGWIKLCIAQLRLKLQSVSNPWNRSLRPGILTNFLFFRAKRRRGEEYREGMVELGKVGKSGFN